MSWYLQVLKKYAVFSGRARRKEYWYFVLFNVVISFVLEWIDYLVGTYYVLSGLYYLAVLLPSMGVSTRRLHDTDHSGWWLLIGLIPLIGPITLLIYMVSEGQALTNQYGPPPKFVEL